MQVFKKKSKTVRYLPPRQGIWEELERQPINYRPKHGSQLDVFISLA